MAALDQFVLPEDPVLADHLVATYLLRTPSSDVPRLLTGFANEQTTGTWIEVPGVAPEMLRDYKAKVVAVFEVPDAENEAAPVEGARAIIFQLAFPWRNFAGQIPMLLTTAFGNISMIGDIKLLELTFPKPLTDALPGPQFGIAGIRKLLDVPERPLLNTMIKPSIGISPELGAERLYAAAIGGADIVKDDEVLADTDFSPVLRRVELFTKKLRQAESETGEKKLYMVNVTDEPERALKKAEAAVEAGATGVMINFLTAGLGLLSSLARNRKVNVPILAHLDFGGALYGSPWHGITSPLLYGKLPRLAGVDLLTIPTPYGKFPLRREKYLRMTLGLRAPLHDKPGAWPIVGGAFKPGHLPRAFAELGRDFVVGAGGAIYAHPMGATAGATAFRQAIDLMMTRGTFDGSETEYPELAAAIAQWGATVEK